MYTEIEDFHYDLQTKSEIKLLLARSDDECDAPYTRILRFSIYEMDNPPPEELESFFPPVLKAIRKMTGLLRISLPPWLLTTEVFSAIQANPSISHLKIYGAVNSHTFPPFLLSPTSLALPPRSLVVDLHLNSTPMSKQQVPKLLLKLATLNTVVEKISLWTDSVPSFLLNSTWLTSLRSLKIQVEPAFTSTMAPWLASVSTLLPSVTSISTVVTDEEGPPFSLSSSNWIRLEGSDDVAVANFVKEWSAATVYDFELVQEVDTSRLSFLAFTITNSTVTRSMITSLRAVVGSVVNLRLDSILSHGIDWDDWEGTISAFDAFESLQRLHLGGTVTPFQTLDVTIGCSLPCVEKVFKEVPSLPADLALIGGLQTLRPLQTQINVARLELLAPHLPPSTAVTWRAGLPGEPVASYVGNVAVDVGGRKSLTFFEDEEGAEEWPSSSIGPACFGCQKHMLREEATHPLQPLMACPIEEVRSALVQGGFDLDAFDSLPVTGDRTPFELFLRSGSSTVNPSQDQGA